MTNTAKWEKEQGHSLQGLGKGDFFLPGADAKFFQGRWGRMGDGARGKGLILYGICPVRSMGGNPQPRKGAGAVVVAFTTKDEKKIRRALTGISLMDY